MPYKTNGDIFKESYYSLIPEKWDVRTISYFTKEMKNGGTPRRSTDEYWVDGCIPWLKTGEINNTLIVNSLKMLKKTNFEHLFNQIYMNLLEIEKLTKLRDTLLPKLMSGEMDISRINFD